MLEIRRERGVYYLYIDGKFYCSCDNDREVEEERGSLQKNNIILNWNNKAPTEKMLVLFISQQKENGKIIVMVK